MAASRIHLMGMQFNSELDERLRQTLRNNGQRLTNQRLAVYNHLHRLGTHPTAEQVHLSVRDDLPNISLATVYKILEVLRKAGLALKISGADSSAHYDHTVISHGHTLCRKCHRVWDLPKEISGKVLKSAGSVPGITVEDVVFEIVGVCDKCAKKGL